MLTLEAINTRIADRVLYATLDSPPLNMIGPDLVRDLITLVRYVESNEQEISVVVFDAASRDFFSAHVDMARVPALGEEFARLEPGATLGTLYRRISSLNQVSIAAIAGRVRGAGCEFILACDMRFAGHRAIFGQPEVGVGAIPGGAPLNTSPGSWDVDAHWKPFSAPTTSRPISPNATVGSTGRYPNPHLYPSSPAWLAELQASPLLASLMPKNVSTTSHCRASTRCKKTAACS